MPDRETNGKNKILVIEDVDLILEALSKQLGRFGYEIVSARDGISGVALAQQELPDLILLDLLLPKRLGIDVLRDLKSDPVVNQIPVIIISNSGQAVEVEEIFALGAADYLVKANFDPEEVIQKIEKILGPRPHAAENI